MGKVITLTDAKGKEVNFAIHHLSEYNSHDIQKDPSRYGLYNIKGTDLYMSSPRMSQIYDLYMRSYDTSVPQSWFNEEMNRTGKAPGAVWCYDNDRVMGAPVFWSDIERRFAKDVIRAMAA